MEAARRFPGRLRELREQAALTQQQLGERVGVTWEAVSRWERGTREPSWSNVVALAKALGVECTVFLQQPAARPPARPGRPRKVPPEAAGQQQAKRPRGRPRRAPGAAQAGRSAGGAAQQPSAQKWAGKRRQASASGEVGRAE